MLLAALAFVHFREKPPEAETMRFEIPLPDRIGEMHPLSLSPDGRRLAIVAPATKGSPAHGSTTAMWIGSIDAKPGEQSLKLLVASATAAAYAPGPAGGVGHLLFPRDGTLMAQPFDAGKLALAGEPVPVAERVASLRGTGFFAASATDILAYRTGGTGLGRANVQLTWFDRDGKVVETAGQPDTYSSLALSPDGTRLAVSRYDTLQSGDTWLIDLARGAARNRFTFGPGLSGAPA
jgi:hypothetical protein